MGDVIGRVRMVGDRIAAWVIGVILVGLAAFLAWPSYEHLTGEVTVYRMFCTVERKADGHCGLRHELTSATETYKAYPEQQSIIVWIGGEAPSKLANCAVRDALNWRCSRVDKKGVTVEQSMADGELSETVNGDAAPGLEVFFQTPRWRWWLVKLLETSGLRK